MYDKFEKDEMILVDYSQYGNLNFRKGKIIEITKAGNYKVLEDGQSSYMIFNSNGRLREKGLGWNTFYIKKFSQDLWDKYLEQNEKSRIVIKINKIRFSDFDINDLREIEKIINRKFQEENK